MYGEQYWHTACTIRQYLFLMCMCVVGLYENNFTLVYRLLYNRCVVRKNALAPADEKA